MRFGPEGSVSQRQTGVSKYARGATTVATPRPFTAKGGEAS